jgi:hypothetical protein
MVVDRIIEVLQTVLITNVAFGDPTRVDLVKSGRIQADPSVTGPLRISVMGGDPEDVNLMDKIADPDSDDNRMAFTIPAREIGGGEMWWHKGTVKLELFFLLTANAPSEEDAREYAYTILGRITDTFADGIFVGDLSDDFGEHAVLLLSTQHSLFQAGGPSNSYLWRGRVVWEALAERNSL